MFQKKYLRMSYWVFAIALSHFGCAFATATDDERTLNTQNQCGPQMSYFKYAADGSAAEDPATEDTLGLHHPGGSNLDPTPDPRTEEAPPFVAVPGYDAAGYFKLAADQGTGAGGPDGLPPAMESFANPNPQPGTVADSGGSDIPRVPASPDEIRSAGECGRPVSGDFALPRCRIPAIPACGSRGEACMAKSADAYGRLVTDNFMRMCCCVSNWNPPSRQPDRMRDDYMARSDPRYPYNPVHHPAIKLTDHSAFPSEMADHFAREMADYSAGDFATEDPAEQNEFGLASLLWTW
jgi:hypothetical protein